MEDTWLQEELGQLKELAAAVEAEGIASAPIAEIWTRGRKRRREAAAEHNQIANAVLPTSQLRLDLSGVLFCGG